MGDNVHGEGEGGDSEEERDLGVGEVFGKKS